MALDYGPGKTIALLSILKLICRFLLWISATMSYQLTVLFAASIKNYTDNLDEHIQYISTSFAVVLRGPALLRPVLVF